MMGGVWDLHTVYRALGIMSGTTIPKGMSTTITYAGMALTVEPTAEKSNRLYRVYVTCTCGRRIAFCKMPQHILSKRHAGDVFATETPESQVLKAEWDAYMVSRGWR